MTIFRTASPYPKPCWRGGRRTKEQWKAREKEREKEVNEPLKWNVMFNFCKCHVWHMKIGPFHCARQSTYRSGGFRTASQPKASDPQTRYRERVAATRTLALINTSSDRDDLSAHRLNAPQSESHWATLKDYRLYQKNIPSTQLDEICLLIPKSEIRSLFVVIVNTPITSISFNAIGRVDPDTRAEILIFKAAHSEDFAAPEVQQL